MEFKVSQRFESNEYILAQVQSDMTMPERQTIK